MKKLTASVLVALTALCLAAPARAKTWNLRYTSSYMETNPVLAHGILPWFERVKEATGGRVKIRNFNPNTICPEGEIYASIISGAIDMGGLNHSRNAGKFPLHDVFTLPLISGSSRAHADAVWTVYQSSPELRREMDEIEVLGYWAGGAMQIMTTARPVKTLEDLKGLRICVLAKPYADMVAAWGGNPIIVPAPDMYMALARNQADGVLFSVAAMGSLKLDESIRYVTLGSFVMDTFYMGMNKERWAALPDDVKRAVRGVTGEDWPGRVSGEMDKGDAAEMAKMSARGLEFYRLPADELQRWIAAAAPLDQAWVDKVVKAGSLSRPEAEALLRKVRAAGRAIGAEAAS